jgi:hypothetical protein
VVGTTGISFTPGGRASGGLALGVAVGTLAALAGAVLWTVLVVVTGYELGLASVAIGFLVGQAIASTRSTHRALPAIGALLALSGCLIGNVLTDAHFFGQVSGWGTFEALTKMISHPDLGRQVLDAGFEPIDVVFWAIAAYEGYKLTARGIIRQTAQRIPPVGVAVPSPQGPAPAPPARHPSDFFTNPDAPPVH